MRTVQLEAEITMEGGLRLLSPLPAWLKPGRAEIALTVQNGPGPESKAKPERQRLTATPEMLAARKAALEEIRRLDPYRAIEDPVVWQREGREDVCLPGRD